MAVSKGRKQEKKKPTVKSKTQALAVALGSSKKKRGNGKEVRSFEA